MKAIILERNRCKDCLRVNRVHNIYPILFRVMKTFTTKSEAIKELFTMLDDCSFATVAYYLSSNFNYAYLPAVTEDEKDNAECQGLKKKSLSLPLQDAAKTLDEVYAFHLD